MTTKKLVFPAQSLMEIAWLYAVVSFATTAIVGHPLTFPACASCFYASTIAGRSVFGKGLRNATILAVHVFTFACMSLIVLHTFFYPSFPLFDARWVSALFSRHDQYEWLNVAIILLTALGLWGGGTALAIRKMEYRKIAGRFDVGLVAFFCLFLLKATLKAKGGIVIAENVSLPCLFLFLSAGLPAIALANRGQGRSRTHLPGYGFVGILVSFTGMVFFAGTMLVVFFTALLSKAAAVGYQGIQTGAMGLFSILSPILRFLYGPRSMPSEPAGASPNAAKLHDAAMPTSWWGKAFYRIIDMGVNGLIIVTAIAAAAFIAYCVISWLLKRKPAQKQKSCSAQGRKSWFILFWSALLPLWRAIQRAFKRHATAIDVYASLIRWGWLSGIARLSWQTPSEFANRLGACFPALKSDIRTILAAYNAEVYGGAMTDEGKMVALRAALRNVRHPRHWPMRARVRITMETKRS